MKLKLRSTLTIFASAIVFSGTIAAQGNYRSSNDYASGVTIYEHCDFKGKSQTLRSGEYRSLRDTGFGNDRVSSIRVPRGSEAVIYEDDDFRGSYARIDRDIRCFDKQWNDEASSISVRGYDNDRGRDSRRNDGYNDRAYDNRNNDRGYDNNRGSSRRSNNTSHNQSNVNAKNIAQVVFDDRFLQQVSTKQWNMSGKRGAPKQFEEVRRDQDSVYLENKYTRERVRIDLFANDVTFVDGKGRQERYGIDRKVAALNPVSNTRRNTAPKPPKPVVSTRAPSGVVASGCFNYKAYTQGGSGGVRFHGKEGFHRFNSKSPHTGRICHNGKLTMEINKTKPGTTVIIEINGESYRFDAGEKEDVLRNNWYRKNIRLTVGK